MNVSWELDLWQKISDGISAANLDAASARASYQSARDSLVANVVRSYIDVLTQQQSSANTRATIAQYENALLTAKRTLAVLLGRQNQSLNELNTQVNFPDVLLPLTTLPRVIAANNFAETGSGT